MSEVIALIIGLVVGGCIVGDFIWSNKDVVLVNYNMDGSKWIRQEGKKFALIELKGDAQ